MRERKLIAEVLERRPGAEQLLEYLGEKIFDAIEEIGAAEEDPVGYLVGEIDKLRTEATDNPGRAMPVGGVPYSRVFEHLDGYEQERMEVRSEVLAKHAASVEEVKAFRNRFLDGGLLTPEQAQAFVTSLANQNLPVQWFDEHKVSFTDHIIDGQMVTQDHRGEIIEFTIQPAGIECQIEKHAHSEEYGGGKRLSVVGDPSDVIQRRRNDVRLPTSEEGIDIIAQEGGLPDLGYWRGFTGYVRTESPLGALRDLGSHLTKRYRGWKPNYATRFVLTGEPPEETSPLRIESGVGGEIVLHVAPWISPESVKNAYMRQLWFRGWMGERYGGSKAKRQRKLNPKTLKLLRFVTARMDRINDPRERRAKGRKVAAQWDAEHPEWAYHGDTRTMWRDYSRALQQVAPPVSGRKSGIQRRLEGAARVTRGEV